MNKTTPIFICDLDRYGRIGHQTSRMLTAFLFAHLTGGNLSLKLQVFLIVQTKSLILKNLIKPSRKILQLNIITLSNGYREPYGNDT